MLGGTFDQMMYQETSSEGVEARKGEVDKHIPWGKFKRHALQGGQTLAEAAQEFRDLINNNRVNCEYSEAHKEWCVPYFSGIRVVSDRVKLSSIGTSRTGRVESSQQLQAMRDGGKALLDQTYSSLSQAASYGLRPLPIGQPVVLSVCDLRAA